MSVWSALLLFHLISLTVITSVAGISSITTFSASLLPEFLTSMINCFGCPATYLPPSTAYLKMPRLTCLSLPVKATDGVSPVLVFSSSFFTLVSLVLSLPVIVTVIVSPALISQSVAVTLFSA